jgi:hypothetical protein
MSDQLLICRLTGKLFPPGTVPESTEGLALVPVEEAEPYYEQRTRGMAARDARRFDRTHLSPENAYRLGRDFVAHTFRYGWPMHIVRNHIGPGATILEMGCGAEIPMFRTLTCDLSAVKYYKPKAFVAADLNRIKYRPAVTGCRSIILSECNIVTNPEKVPADLDPFDLIVSFEVIEHMGKEDGLVFLDRMFEFARRGRTEGRCLLAVSTPVNDGFIAKNHVYEWQRSEMRRAFETRGGTVLKEFGMFSNLRPLINALTEAERAVWNDLADFHSPHMLSALFSVMHPEVARNIAWLVEVKP